MRWAGHLVRMDANKLATRAEVGKTSRMQEKGKATAEMGGLREEGHEKIGGRMKDGERERPIENYGKKEQPFRIKWSHTILKYNVLPSFI